MLNTIIKDIVHNDLKRIAILAHKYLDYGALCSAHALADILYQGVINYKYPQWQQLNLEDRIFHGDFGKQTFLFPIVEKTDIGDYKLSSFSLLTENKDFSQFIKQDSFDAAIVCDVNEQDRIYGGEILNSVSPEHIYLFDHHIGNRNELNILPENQLVKRASSTCEIILQDALNERLGINLRTMRNLYAGIVTDTCVFLFGVNDFTLRIKNNDINGLNQQEKKKIENIFDRLYEEDVYNLQQLQKIDYSSHCLNIYYIKNPKTSKQRGTYIASALEKQIIPDDNSVSVLFAIYDGYTEIKFRKGKNSHIMISELAKSFHGGGNED